MTNKVIEKAVTADGCVCIVAVGLSGMYSWPQISRGCPNGIHRLEIDSALEAVFMVFIDIPWYYSKTMFFGP